MDYRNRFSRLRRNIKTRNDIRNDIKEDIRKDYLKDKLKVFGELTKLVDALNDTYKRDSLAILEKLDNINKGENNELEIPNMDSTKLILNYMIDKINCFSK